MADSTNENPIYRVSQQWCHDCLEQESSLFTPGRPIWSSAVVDDLCRRFVDAPDAGEGSFVDKLRGQLAGASDLTIQLAAEALFVHFLAAGDIKAATKLTLVQQVLAWMAEPARVPEALVAALDRGFASTGVAFKTYRPFQVGQVLVLARELGRLDRTARAQTLSEPWAFKALLYGHEVRSAATQRNALLHLLHPQTFEPCVSDGHKQQMLEGFGEYALEDEADIDRQLVAIRRGLEQELGPGVSFYSPELRPRWMPEEAVASSPPEREPRRTPQSVLEALFRDPAVRARAARELQSSVEVARSLGEETWGTSLFRDRIRLNVGPMQALVLMEESLLLVLDGARLREPRFSTLSSFVRRTAGEYKSYPSAVDIVIPSERIEALAPLARELHESLIRQLAARSRRTSYRKSHDPAVLTWINGWLKGPQEGVPTAPSLSDLEARLYFPEGALEVVAELLEDKGQVILSGPPGTGKTLVALELAKWIAGSPERIEKVQLHPSYAYEDFVEGFRPKVIGGAPGFVLKDGPLKRIAEAARRDPGHTHVLLIDEINRGNVAKVFGELYYLLEYREESLRLPYSEEPFALPKNLRVIGTMNTADRSIALVDLALRRRFHFVEFFPDVEPVRGVLRAWLRDQAPSLLWLADVVERANALLGDRDASIGPSYFMRRGLDEDRLERIWLHSVLPFVGEQLYGQPERLRSFQLATLRAELARGQVTG